MDPIDYTTGFWYSKSKKHLPMPIETKTPVCNEWVQKLTSVIYSRFTTSMGFMGYSHCRLCDKWCNGSHTYLIVYKHIECAFPQGLLHYYRDHNVQPDPWFVNFINMIYKKENIKASKKTTWESREPPPPGPWENLLLLADSNLGFPVL